MHLKDLKAKNPSDLLTYAESLDIENASTLRKQDMMFACLKKLADNDIAIPLSASFFKQANIISCFLSVLAFSMFKLSAYVNKSDGFFALRSFRCIYFSLSDEF